MGEPLPAEVRRRRLVERRAGRLRSACASQTARAGTAPGSSSSHVSSTARRSVLLRRGGAHARASRRPGSSSHPTLYRSRRARRTTRDVVESFESYEECVRARAARTSTTASWTGPSAAPRRSRPRLDIDVLTRDVPDSGLRDSRERASAAIVGTGFIARVHAIALRDLGVEVVAVCSRTTLGRRSARRGDRRTRQRVRLARRAARRGRGRRRARLHAERAPRGADAAGTRARRARRLREAARDERRGERAHARRRSRQATAWAPSATTCAATRSSSTCGAVVEAGDLGELRVRARALRLRRRAPRPGPAGALDPPSSGPSYVTATSARTGSTSPSTSPARRIVEVLADFRTFVPGGPLEDYAALLLRFDGGATGSAAFSALGAGRKNQLLFELEGSRAGFTWDQESPNELLHRHADDADARSSSRIRRRTPAARRSSRGTRPATARATATPFAILLDAYRAMAGEAHGPFPTFVDGHRGIADPRRDRSAARATAAGFRSSCLARAPGHEPQRPAARSRAARTPTPSDTATRRAAAPRARSPRA